MPRALRQPFLGRRQHEVPRRRLSAGLNYLAGQEKARRAGKKGGT